MRTWVYTNEAAPHGDAIPALDFGLALPAPDAQLDQSQRDPVAVYLSRLSPGSRRVMASALNTVARLLSGGVADARQLPWHQLGYEHV